MPIVRLLQQSAFDPEAVKRISEAFDQGCKTLGLKDRADPLTELFAQKVIEAARTGERDPTRISKAAISSLSPDSVSDTEIEKLAERMVGKP